MCHGTAGGLILHLGTSCVTQNYARENHSFTIMSDWKYGILKSRAEWTPKNSVFHPSPPRVNETDTEQWPFIFPTASLPPKKLSLQGRLLNDAIISPWEYFMIQGHMNTCLHVHSYSLSVHIPSISYVQSWKQYKLQTKERIKRLSTPETSWI